LPWVGAAGIFSGHPLSMLVHGFYHCINAGTPLDIRGAFSHSFHLHVWPMLLIFGLFSGVVWGFIGFILQPLRESRLRLETLHRELLEQTRHLNTYLTISSMVANPWTSPNSWELSCPPLWRPSQPKRRPFCCWTRVETPSARLTACRFNFCLVEFRLISQDRKNLLSGCAR
jgi:hypothetical protein